MTLRELTREAVRARIADVAVDLFAEHGFEQVTVEQVAEAAGISARSFNRYFATKEDAVVGDPADWGAFVCDAVQGRPRDESAWISLYEAFASLLVEAGIGGDQHKRVMRVINSSPSLQARNLEKHLLWARMLIPLVAERLGGVDAALRAEALVLASLSCFDLALTAWARNEETRSPSDLLEISFSTLGLLR